MSSPVTTRPLPGFAFDSTPAEAITREQLAVETVRTGRRGDSFLADDPEPTLAERIAELARDECTLRRRGTEAALATADECQRMRGRLEVELAAAEVCS